MWLASPPDSHTLDFFSFISPAAKATRWCPSFESKRLRETWPALRVRRLPNGGRGRKAQVARLGGERGLDATRWGLRGGRCVFNTEVFHQLSHAATPGTGWRRAPR